MKMNYNPKLVNINGQLKLIDESNQLNTKKAIRMIERYASYFEDTSNLVLSSRLNYLEIEELIKKINSKIEYNIEISEEVSNYISNNKYAIKEQRIAGLTIKAYDNRWDEEIFEFNRILNQEISRPLKKEQLQASFYLTKMKKAANFSVPGSGKTAMMYGTYAYLSSTKINEIDKILVISPLNAFEAWRSEYEEVFGNKRELMYLNLREINHPGDIRSQWGLANVIILNYESLAGWKLSVMNDLINEKTMVVFDEVHRIKNPNGKYAENALSLGKNARYFYTLTGTPIPNSYLDLYNMLHILYNNEYDTFFGWDTYELKNPNVDEVNNKLQPFFWRTTKQDLHVPKADDDKIIEVSSNSELDRIVSEIYRVEDNVLALYIRLLQASTNPALLTEKINLNEIGFVEDEVDFTKNSALNIKEEELAKSKAYLNLNVENIRTSKFDEGMRLIKELIIQGKKVLVWGIFVGTMKKIRNELDNLGIKSHLIFGETPKNIRSKLIDDFRDGDVQVLISNPATLGESISLHQTVHDAIYFEYNFNLTFMLQSRDRIHRLGLPENQYTRYYYLMTEGNLAHAGLIDRKVYKRLKEKEAVMLDAIEGDLLVPMIEDDYLDEIKNILG